jgi:hypothetical protein
MEPVIIWAAVVGSGVFGLGLTSAILGKRKARIDKEYSRNHPTAKVMPQAETNARESQGMSMAAGGIKNGEQNLASIGSHPS